MDIQVRKYTPQDCKETRQLFYDTVHTVNAKDYTKSQLSVWAPLQIDIEKWNDVFMRSYTIVAEIDNVIVGFCNIKKDYIDRLYVHKDYQGKGVGYCLITEAENNARLNMYSIITSHVSITAKSFFERQGYVVIRPNNVERDGILLTNYVMQKKFD